MSVIQEALRKSVGDQDPPSSLPPDLEDRNKGGGKSSKKQIGLVIVLLLCLIGVLSYSFYPYLWAPARKNQVPPSSKMADGKEGGPALKAPPVKEPAGPPSSVAVRRQDQSPVKEKPLPSPLPREIGPKKEEAPRATHFASGPKAPETEKALKGERIFKTLSPTMAGPGSRARNIDRSSSKDRLALKGAAAKISGPLKAQKEPEEKDSLEIIGLFNEAVQDQQKGFLDQAIQTYQEILTIRPNHPETYNNLGLIYQEQKRFSKALEMFQKALSLNPQYLKGFNNLGLLYLNQGKFDEAALQFRKALELDPNFIPAYINLSALYKRQGRVDLARKTLYLALEHDGDNLEAQYNLGLLWEIEGVANKALEHYQKFVSKTQGPPYSTLANELKKRWPELK